MPESESSNTSSDSFQVIIGCLNRGEEAGAREIFECFAKPLIAHARHRLSPRVKQKVDPEDVVQSVFKSFFKRHASGQFDLENWEGLWGLLLQMTIRKCQRSIEKYSTQLRNLDVECTASINDLSRPKNDPPSREPAPPEIAMLNETIDGLKAELDPLEWEILTLRLGEHSIPEISQIVSRSERTVSRTIHRIKSLLSDEESN